MIGFSNKQNGNATSLRKVKVSFKNSQVIVKSKLNKDNVINQREIEVFNSKFIRGLMRPKVTGKRRIEYLAPGNVRLSEYLKSGLSKNDFYIIFAQFVECLKKVEWNGFDVNNIILNIDYIFYNQMTKEVQFIYQPITNPPNINNVYAFIYNLANQVVLNVGEDDGFLNHLVGTVRSLQTLSTTVLENYIINNYPQVYKQVRRTKPGESQQLQSSGRTYFEKKYDETGGKAFREQIDEEIEETGLLEEDIEETGLLAEDDEEGTTLLDGEEGTTLLRMTEPVYPYLIRLNTYEKVTINKPVFRIGKEKSYVDYFIINNNAVSRIHADIITDAENGCYYVKDNNSTNHTFVNGTMIVTNQNTEIFDGDAIMFANEPFEFHIG